VALTQAQKTTLKAHIAANTAAVTFSGQSVAVNALANGPDENTVIAAWYNLAASPAFVLWRQKVPLAEIAVKLNGTELAGLTSLNHTRLQTVVTLVNAAGGANPSIADQRAFWDDIFSGAGGTNTRAALLVLWKELATNVEKLFAAGTGSDAVPAVSAFPDGFALTATDVQEARDQG
jgi:hypothetical protein